MDGLGESRDSWFISRGGMEEEENGSLREELG